MVRVEAQTVKPQNEYDDILGDPGAVSRVAGIFVGESLL